MHSYHLFLDDFRMPEDCLEYINDHRYRTLSWVIVRSHEEFVELIEQRWAAREFPSLVSFDHDLKDEHYHPSMFQGVDAYENAYTRFTSPTGRRSAEFLVEFCKENNLSLPECLIHTRNPAGKERISNTLDIQKKRTSNNPS